MMSGGGKKRLGENWTWQGDGLENNRGGGRK